MPTVPFACRRGKVRTIGAGFWRRGRRIYETHSNLRGCIAWKVGESQGFPAAARSACLERRWRKGYVVSKQTQRRLPQGACGSIKSSVSEDDSKPGRWL